MSERLARKCRRAQHWRQRAARVRYNERHTEWSRRNRFWWRTMHPDPSLRLPSPAEPQPGDGWWALAMQGIPPSERNRLSQPGHHVAHRIDIEARRVALLSFLMP